MLQCEECTWKLCILQCELHLCCSTSTVCSSRTNTTTAAADVKGALAAAGTYACAFPQKYDKKDANKTTFGGKCGINSKNS